MPLLVRPMAFRLVAPETPEEAFRLLQSEPTESRCVLAGGTDLLLDIDSGRSSPRVVVSLRNLPWSDLRWEAGSLLVGSTLPLADLERAPELPRRIPGLFVAIRAVGSLPLRHRATLGGNLGRSAPASDLLPILIALDSTVLLTSRSGERTLPVSDFVLGSRKTALGPGELIRAVRIPARASAYLWQRVRPANDISQVGVAVARTSAHAWRITVGGVTPSPERMLGAERLLSGRSPSMEAAIAAATQASVSASFSSDKRASEAYRRQLLRVLTERAISAVGSMGDPA
jgi:carbon-monoxide dehydrogenase medium subunit